MIGYPLCLLSYSMLNIKYNLIPFNELVVNLDRLSRFKLPENSFPRVFYSIVLKYLINPKYSKNDILNEDVSLVSEIVKQIWNDSVDKCCKSLNINTEINSAIKTLIKNTFKNIDDKTSVLIKTNLNIAPILEKINYENAPLNLKFLIKLNELGNIFSFNQIRENFSLCFPVSKLLIVEGITEEILLPVFADKLGKNFNKNGIFVLGAGGKSKSPPLYLNLKDKLKIPVILLFDYDAKDICANLESHLLKKDKCILIEKGEFEDILPVNLIKRTLNKEYLPATPLKSNDFSKQNKMCVNIENFFRTRHVGEFKKSKFAKMLVQNVKYKTDITEDIEKIIFSIYS